MAETASCPPSQADCNGSDSVATYNICNGCNGGLESALREMEAMDVDIGVFLESKVTNRIYTQSLSGYSIVASNTFSTHQGGNTLFWQPNKSYEVKDWQIRGPNVMSFTIFTGSQQFLPWGATSHQKTLAHYNISSKPGTSARVSTSPSSLAT